MVYGIEKFKEYFRDYSGQYVFIGGTACSILLYDIGASFRATKDLDIVLLIEAIDENFGFVFWKFIEDGGYLHKQKNTGKEQFYRFTNPENKSFPAMIELFSRKPENLKSHFDSVVTPIYVSESVISLSAILLNDAYYNLLIEGKSMVDGYSVLSIEYILLFKMKAWIDLFERKKNGEQIDARDVNKHKNDVFRLLINVSPSSRIGVNDEIKEDILRFLDMVSVERVDLKSLGIRTVSLVELLNRIYILYDITKI